MSATTSPALCTVGLSAATAHVGLIVAVGASTMTVLPEFVTYHVDYPVSIPLQAVQILFHLNGGYTKVLFSQFRSWGRPVAMDIPTRLIPPHLRRIGSCFLLGAVRRSLDTFESADAVRASRDLAYQIEELSPERASFEPL